MNNAPNIHELKKKIIVRAIAAFFVVLLILFVPAGSIYYWQAWIYLLIIFVPFILVISYFLKHDPALLQRRMQMKEKEFEQKIIVYATGIIFFIGFLVPGLDYRFQWSQVPVEIVILSNSLVLLGYFLVFRVFKENSYASRVIQVEKGQKVISTGPYVIVRHPMYVGVIIMYLFTPLALGSLVGVLFFLPLLPFLVFRIRNEEKVLLRDLPGYKEYCQKVRYRLIPFVW